MQIISTAFENNQKIPSQYTCDGADINPQLIFSDVPEKAKSLVLIVDDPDAARGDWVHWLLWNVPPETKELAEKSVPAMAIQGVTDFGNPGYGGPCPSRGLHRYQFKLYALDVILDLPITTAKKDLEKNMFGHILDQAKLVGLYQR